MALIGVGNLRNENDLNKALDSGFSEFIAVGCASMLNKDLGILLNENRGNEIMEEIDPDSPEKYCWPEPLWKIGLQGISYFPPVKGKHVERMDDV